MGTTRQSAMTALPARLTDAEWAVLQPLTPVNRPEIHPAVDPRAVEGTEQPGPRGCDRGKKGGARQATRGGGHAGAYVGPVRDARERGGRQGGAGCVTCGRTRRTGGWWRSAECCST